MKNVLIISKIYTNYSLGLSLNHTHKSLSLSLFLPIENITTRCWNIMLTLLQS